MVLPRKTQTGLRLPDDVLAKVRVRADTVGISQNEWMTRALRWALEQPVTDRRTTKVVEETV